MPNDRIELNPHERAVFEEIFARDRERELNPGELLVREGRGHPHPRAPRVDNVLELKKNFQGTYVRGSSIVFEGLENPMGNDDIVYIKEVTKCPDTRGLANISIAKLFTLAKIPPVLEGVSGIVEGYPSFGLVNHKTVVINTVRLPRRQWKRGYNKSIVRLSSPVAQEMKYLAMYKVGYRMPPAEDKEFVKSLFRENYIPFDKSYQRVADCKAVASAFSNKFSVVNKHNTKTLMISYRDYIIGVVDDNLRITLSRNVRHLEQELGQFAEVVIK